MIKVAKSGLDILLGFVFITVVGFADSVKQIIEVYKTKIELE